MRLHLSFAAAFLIMILTAGCGGRTPSSVLTFFEESGSSASTESSAVSAPDETSPIESAPTGYEEETSYDAQEAHTGPEASEVNIISSGGEGFRFGLLTEEEQGIYKELVRFIAERESVFSVYAPDSTAIRNALRAVVDDHPEFFWLSGSASIYGYKGPGMKEITLDFSIEPEAIEVMQESIDRAAEEYLASLPDNASEYDKVRAAYEYIIRTTDYELNAYQGQNITSVLAFHKSVCAGYAKAFKYLLDRAGVWCAYMTGKVTRDDIEESHAWNMVRIDGTDVYVDITWGDPTYDETVDRSLMPEVTYDYFCITTSDMVRTLHVPDDYYELPDCSSRAYDYYVLNGWYYETFDEELIRSRMMEAIDQNENEVHFKFGSFEAYSAASAAIFDGDILYNALQQRMIWDGVQSITYSPVRSDGLCTIDIYW